jgi:ATP adenylyltransferase
LSAAARGIRAGSRNRKQPVRGRPVAGTAARARSAPASRAGLDKLWAPWRMGWLRHADEPRGCLFCRVAGDANDRRDLVLARNASAVLMLNRYPYSSAHLMVAVKRHAGQFHELSADEMLAVQQLAALAELALAAEYAPHGLNYGLNVGKVAGAGFPGHFHLHMVPRWDGDTNFMPMIAQSRVLPESLGVTWSRLRRTIATLGPSATGVVTRQPARLGRPGLRPVNAARHAKAGKHGA